jgi:hypothetical protein
VARWLNKLFGRGGDINRLTPGALGPSVAGVLPPEARSFEDLKRLIHGKLVDKLDLSRLNDLQGDTRRREIRLVVERLCDTENPLLNRMERERLIDEVLDETFGFGPLEVLFMDPRIRAVQIHGPQDIRCQREGGWERTDIRFRDSAHLNTILDRVRSGLNDGVLGPGFCAVEFYPAPRLPGFPLVVFRRLSETTTREYRAPEHLVRLPAALIRLLHGKLVEKLDLSRVIDLNQATLHREIRLVVERLCDTENPLLNRLERERLIEAVLEETFGFGALAIPLQDPAVDAIALYPGRQVKVWRAGEWEELVWEEVYDERYVRDLIRRLSAQAESLLRARGFRIENDPRRTADAPGAPLLLLRRCAVGGSEEPIPGRSDGSPDARGRETGGDQGAAPPCSALCRRTATVPFPPMRRRGGSLSNRGGALRRWPSPPEARPIMSPASGGPAR